HTRRPTRESSAVSRRSSSQTPNSMNIVMPTEQIDRLPPRTDLSLRSSRPVDFAQRWVETRRAAGAQKESEMRLSSRRAWTVLLATVVALPLSGLAAGPAAAAVTTFTDSTVVGPNSIVLGPDGNMWFTNAGNSSIG